MYPMAAYSRKANLMIFLIGKPQALLYNGSMKILIISNLYPPAVLGGYEILCGQVVQFLQQRGHQVTVVTSDHGDAEAQQGVLRTLKLFVPFGQPAGMHRMKRLRAARYNYRETARVIREAGFDAVFVWSLLRLTPSPLRAASDAGVPAVCTFNDENISGYLPSPFSPAPKSLLRWAADRLMPQITLRGIDFPCTTCISRLIKENLVNRGLPIASSRVIYQGIPLERFPVKSSPGVIGTPVKLLYAGQLHPYKGVHTILSALELLKQDSLLPPFELTIAGQGPQEYTDRLRDQAAAGDLPAKLAGSAAHHQMPEVYRAHDIFIFPSIWQEPFGLTHLEAMASGIPVVSTAHGGQGEFLIDGENCLTFPAEDAEALAGQLKRLMTDPGLSVSLAAEGRRTAEQSFSFTRYAEELEDLLAEAAGYSGEIVN